MSKGKDGFPSRARVFGAKYQNYRFISEFHTPQDSVWCPHFFILHQAAGCPYHCSYCYLRVLLCGKTHPRWYNNLDLMEQEVKFWMEQNKVPCSLNAGSVCDSLAINTNYLARLIPLFAAQERHHLNILSKAGINCEEAKNPIGDVEPTDRVAFAWTVNCDEAAARYERNAPSPVNRLKLAKLYQDCGWHIRYRIDPIMPVPNWESEYARLIDSIAKYWARPDVITIGSLRALFGLKHFSKGEPYNPCIDLKDVLEHDKDFHHWRLIEPVRREMYEFIIDRIHKRLGDVPVALCKETKQMCRQVLGGLPTICNCVGLA